MVQDNLIFPKALKYMLYKLRRNTNEKTLRHVMVLGMLQYGMECYMYMQLAWISLIYCFIGLNMTLLLMVIFWAPDASRPLIVCLHESRSGKQGFDSTFATLESTISSHVGKQYRLIARTRSKEVVFCISMVRGVRETTESRVMRAQGVR